MKTRFFEWHFRLEVDEEDEDRACRVAAKMFEKESKEWRRRNGGMWRSQIRRPDLEMLKTVEVKM